MICIGVNTYLCGVTGVVAAMAIVLHLGWAVPGNQKFYTCSNEGGSQGIARLLAGLDSTLVLMTDLPDLYFQQIFLFERCMSICTMEWVELRTIICRLRS
jgi:hypothetical protein